MAIHENPMQQDAKFLTLKRLDKDIFVKKV